MLVVKRFCLCCFMGCVLIVYGCGTEPSPPAKPPSVKIGVVYPFSGHSASSGQDLKAAVDLACDIINGVFDYPIPLARTKGLPGHNNISIEIVYKDSGSDESKAAALVEEMITQEKVTAVLGCYNSAVTAAASEQAEVMKTPFLNPDSTSPVLIQRGLKWFFRTTPDDTIFAENFFAFFTDLRERLGFDVSDRLLLVYENRLWGTSVSRAERKQALRYDYQIVGDIPYDAASEAVGGELDRIEQALPGVILQSSYADDAVRFMEGYKERNINPQAIVAMNAGFISPMFLEHLGEDGEYIFSREVWAPDIGRTKPVVTEINRIFSSRYGRNMNGNSARAFTGMIVLADAINRAGTTEKEQIRKALLETNISGDQLIMPWDGVRFNPENGQNIKGRGIIVQVLNGVYQTVWPLELAQQKPVWPMPAWSERYSGAAP